MSLKFAILGILRNTGPQSGYDIKQHFTRGPRNIWEADLSQIYRMLDRLESDALVESQPDPDSNRGRRVYNITPDGQQCLQTWLEEDYDLPVVRDPALLRLFFARLVPVEHLRQQITDYRQKHLELEAGYSGIEHHLHGHLSAGELNALFQLLTLNLGKRYTQMTIEWCDDVLQQLDQLATNNNNQPEQE